MREDMEPVPPCRIFMRDGKSCDEVVTERIPSPRSASASGQPLRFGVPDARPVAATREQVIELKKAGVPAKAIACRLGCSLGTVYNRLAGK